MTAFSSVKKLQKNKGQSLAEYGLILALIAVVSIAALSTLGTQIKGSLTNISSQLQTALNQTP
ncbi:MAG: Flp family type IVb pilin [Cyanobacteria bacterium]|nr:Flp family type IVb pilin [Cyanobacteriota bacterium]